MARSSIFALALFRGMAVMLLAGVLANIAHADALSECNRLTARQDWAAAFEPCRQAGQDPSVAGQAAWQHRMGFLYETVRKDDAQAVYWYRKAAEQGNAGAQSNLGLMYSQGRGVAKDEAQAVYWYRKAAEQNNISAQANLAMMHAAGLGVPRNEVEARAWLENGTQQCLTKLEADPKATCDGTCGTVMRYTAMAREIGMGGTQDKAAARALYTWYKRCPLVPQVDSPLVSKGSVRGGSYWNNEARFMRSGVLLEPDADFWESAGILTQPVQREFWPQPIAKTKYLKEFDTSVIAFRNADWNDARINKTLQRASDILAQCGIRLRRAIVTSGDGTDDYLNGILPFSSPVVEERLRQPIPDSPYLRIIMSRSGETSFFTLNLLDLRWPGSIVMAANMDGVVLAHELGHAMGGFIHPLNFEPNIMQYLALTTDRFTSKQCEDMRAWPYLFPLSVAKGPNDLKQPAWPSADSAGWIDMKLLQKEGKFSEANALWSKLHTVKKHEASRKARRYTDEALALQQLVLLVSGDPQRTGWYHSMSNIYMQMGYKRAALFYQLLASSVEVGRPQITSSLPLRFTIPKEEFFKNGQVFNSLAVEYGLSRDEVFKVYRQMRGWRIENGWVQSDADVARLPDNFSDISVASLAPDATLFSSRYNYDAIQIMVHNKIQYAETELLNALAATYTEIRQGKQPALNACKGNKACLGKVENEIHASFGQRMDQKCRSLPTSAFGGETKETKKLGCNWLKLAIDRKKDFNPLTDRPDDQGRLAADVTQTTENSAEISAASPAPDLTFLSGRYLHDVIERLVRLSIPEGNMANILASSYSEIRQAKQPALKACNGNEACLSKVENEIHTSFRQRIDLECQSLPIRAFEHRTEESKRRGCAWLNLAIEKKKDFDPSVHRPN